MERRGESREEERESGFGHAEDVEPSGVVILGGGQEEVVEPAVVRWLRRTRGREEKGNVGSIWKREDSLEREMEEEEETVDSRGTVWAGRRGGSALRWKESAAAMAELTVEMR
ncbi:hypothetical protein Nepgr_032515 [Nepenthes gracilis]|uniref:Uncharacterized protein n=1 Tax=Nepenthes gracilis TaxID=150966 RepID=A0AAD3Y5T9_NEPGR|nr:hypothetical protein Nepgr_032515 [Nepenthes gracilis]